MGSVLSRMESESNDQSIRQCKLTEQCPDKGNRLHLLIDSELYK